MTTAVFSIPPFRFDTATDTLWSGKRARRLRPRAAGLLRYLIERRGEVVTPDEILRALWPGVQVSPGVVKVHVWEVRQALRDPQGKPRFLETVPKRGYRWIAPATELTPEPASAVGRPLLVGRERELAFLGRRVERARGGERQVVFVTGEPGAGKTALLDGLLDGLVEQPGIAVATGQCIEHSGPGEAYLPVLSALGQLGQGARRRALVRVLARHAPTWLVQLPSLLDAKDAAEARRAAHGASRERMLRELAEALEHLTARSALVLVLEDLQWSDASTLDLIALLARRTARARLVVIGTHRPADVAGGAHPLPGLVRELALHDRCSELPLALLAEADVADYLRARVGGTPDPAGVAEVARAIHQRTEGNPLFMVNVVDDLLGDAGADDGTPLVLDRDAARRVRESVPASLRQAIEARLDRLADADQRLLEAASAVGAELSAAALAAALERPVEEVEQHAVSVARRAHLIEERGAESWADGTTAARFAFVHALYQGVLHDRLTPARRRALHLRIGERLEQAHGARASEIAATLAIHFEEAQDLPRAQSYLEAAAENALRKQANAEAARHLTRALTLLLQAPPSRERDEKELGLQVRLGAPLLMTRGYAAPEVIDAYGRALELCRVVGEGPQQLLALAGVYRFFLIRSELRTAHDLAGQVLGFGERHGLALALQTGHLMLGISSFGLGEVVAAHDHLAQALNLYDASLRSVLATSFGDDPAVVCLAHTAMCLWFLGRPDQALARSEEALALARETALPQGLVFALNYATWCRLLRREGDLARAHADELVRVATDNDFAYWVAQGLAIRGWVLIEAGENEAGVAEIRRGLAAYEAIGAEVMRPWHLVRLGEALGRLGRIDEGLAALAESLATMRRRDERFYEAELYRIEGELRRASGDETRAAERFAAALETARRQQAPSLELRAALSLARLLRTRGERASAHALLAPAVVRFDEGHATGDLRDAQALLAELA